MPGSELGAGDAIGRLVVGAPGCQGRVPAGGLEEGISGGEMRLGGWRSWGQTGSWEGPHAAHVGLWGWKGLHPQPGL